MKGAPARRASRRAISVLPTPVGPIMMMLLGMISSRMSSGAWRRRQRFRRAMATLRFASSCPMTYLSRAATIWRGVRSPSASGAGRASAGAGRVGDSVMGVGGLRVRAGEPEDPQLGEGRSSHARPAVGAGRGGRLRAAAREDSREPRRGSGLLLVALVLERVVEVLAFLLGFEVVAVEVVVLVVVLALELGAGVAVAAEGVGGEVLLHLDDGGVLAVDDEAGVVVGHPAPALQPGGP